MNPPLMATHTGTEKVVNIGTSMFEQLAEVDVRSLSPESARMFLQLSFNHSQQRRMDELSEKASQGTLTSDESRTLDESIPIGNLLAILQSKARRALKQAVVSEVSHHAGSR